MGSHSGSSSPLWGPSWHVIRFFNPPTSSATNQPAIGRAVPPAPNVVGAQVAHQGLVHLASLLHMPICAPIVFADAGRGIARSAVAQYACQYTYILHDLIFSLSCQRESMLGPSLTNPEVHSGVPLWKHEPLFRRLR